MNERLQAWWRHPPSYRVVRLLFPRLLAQVYLIAFVSWGLQCDGLVGEHGILPAGAYLKDMHDYAAQTGKIGFNDLPGLFWWHYSDALLHVVCWGGAVLALFVMAGVLQGPLLALLWFGYLSICTTGGIFMGYQWDALLLEAGFLTLFLAPWRLRGKAGDEAPTGSVFLLHWLVFRLMLLSGYVKIGGGDPVWLSDTALLYHFESQPLPTWVAWWAHQLPRGVQVFNCKAMFIIELWLPVVIFLGRWGRILACAGFSLLMAGIAVTGNYTFFNLLTIFLSFTLLDDRCWPAIVIRWLRIPMDAPLRTRWQRRHAGVYATSVALIFFSLVAADEFLQGRVKAYKPHAPNWAQSFYQKQLAPWRSINAYGLFQSMTTERNEVVVEVSDDGVFWEELSFRWKPTRVKEAPGFCAPYQPRLDWQMWFAALYPGYVPQRDADPRSPMYWFGPFMMALIHHEEAVWNLVGESPLPRAKVTHARALLYRYQFTTQEERKTTGAWWKRTRVGAFSPAFGPGEER